MTEVRVSVSRNGRGAGKGGPLFPVLLAVMILALALAEPAGAASYTRTFSNSESKDLADLATTTFDLPVSGLSSTVTDVNVALRGLNHTFMNDLVVSVKGPTGASVQLWAHIGGGDDAVDTAMTLDDAAPTSVTSATSPFSGTWKPSGSLATFNGLDPNGTWTLTVQDTMGGDVGRLTNGWTLVITVHDTTPPVTIASFTPAANAAGWTNAPVSATLTATDGDSGVTSTEYRLAGAATWAPYAPFVIGAEGKSTHEYRSTDGAGNVEDAQSETFFIDLTAPVTTQSGLDGQWHKTPWNVVLTAVDQVGLSGVATTEYALDSGDYVPCTSATIQTEGWHVFHYRSTDVAGNTEGAKSATVGFDNTAPATTDNAPGGWQTSSPVTVALTGNDGAGSGVARIRYRLDGASSWTDSAAAPARVVVSGDGAHIIRYRSIDAAGNCGAIDECTIKLDATAPVTTVTSTGNAWHRGPVTLVLSATDDGSGVARTEYSTNGGASWTAGTSLIVADEGATAVEYRSRDKAGNLETAGRCAVNLDTRAPTTVATKAVFRRGKKAVFRVKVSDGLPCSRAGARVTIRIWTAKGKLVAALPVYTDVKTNMLVSLAWATCTLAKGRYVYSVSATDAAGNVQSKAGRAALKVK